MSIKAKSVTLSDKISDLLTSVPKSFDPEDYVHEESVAKVVEPVIESDLDNEVPASQFRKQNIDLLEDVDKRYVGRKSSRKDFEDSDEYGSEDGQSSCEEEEISETHSDENESDGETCSDEEDDVEMEDDDNEGDDKFLHMSANSNKVDKGNCVRNQLSLWESLLEMRIQLQKSLITSNKLPQLETFQQFKEDYPEFNVKVEETRNSIFTLLDKFLSLQNLLQNQFPETKDLHKVKIRKNVESTEGTQSDAEEEIESSDEEEEEAVKPDKKRVKLEDFEKDISEHHEMYTKYRNSVITKWYDKTKLLTGKNNVQQSVINQINFILNDKQRLIKRTHLKRSQYEIVGKKCDKEEEVKEATEEDVKQEDEYDTEIFDDDDFYHQLLRELIEVKSADLTDPVQIGRQWIELQNLRSKMKRKIDTKATKGRKIRYAVHTKLVNFMAPIEENSSWTNEAKNELFGSLFGKNNNESDIK